MLIKPQGGCSPFAMPPLAAVAAFRFRDRHHQQGDRASRGPGRRLHDRCRRAKGAPSPVGGRGWRMHPGYVCRSVSPGRDSAVPDPAGSASWPKRRHYSSFGGEIRRCCSRSSAARCRACPRPTTWSSAWRSSTLHAAAAARGQSNGAGADRRGARGRTASRRGCSRLQRLCPLPPVRVHRRALGDSQQEEQQDRRWSEPLPSRAPLSSSSSPFAMRNSSPTHLDLSHGSSLAERLNWTRFQLQDLELVWHPRGLW